MMENKTNFDRVKTLLASLGIVSVVDIIAILAGGKGIGNMIEENPRTVLLIGQSLAWLTLIFVIIYMGLGIMDSIHNCFERKKEKSRKRLSKQVWNKLDGIIEVPDLQLPNAIAVRYEIPLETFDHTAEARNLVLSSAHCSKEKCNNETLLTIARPGGGGEGMHCPRCQVTYTEKSSNVFHDLAQDFLHRRIKILLSEIQKGKQ